MLVHVDIEWTQHEDVNIIADSNVHICVDKYRFWLMDESVWPRSDIHLRRLRSSSAIAKVKSASLHSFCHCYKWSITRMASLCGKEPINDGKIVLTFLDPPSIYIGRFPQHCRERHLYYRVSVHGVYIFS